MQTEIRRVSRNWKHPRDEAGQFVPLLDRYAESLQNWEEENRQWANGLRKKYDPLETVTFEEWFGERPDPTRYMPDWPEQELTHFQMYETTTEGTPISPVMPSIEEVYLELGNPVEPV
jgi:hypothetical protein